MRVSIVARVIRIPALAAAVVVPMLVAACSNDPLAPAPQASRASTEVTRSDSAGRTSSGGSMPWFDSQSAGKSTGGSMPWFDSQTAGSQPAGKSGGSMPWF